MLRSENPGAFKDAADFETRYQFDLSCVSCPWTLKTNDREQAEREALRHMDENNHCVMDDRKED